MKPLAVIPSYLTTPSDVEMLSDCVKSIRETEQDALDVLVVDDGSPESSLVDAIEGLTDRWAFEVHRKQDNEGFSKTVNVGLERAMKEERDAILVNADIEFFQPWLETMLNTERLVNDGPADVVGALLIYPQSGLIQHGGVYFSLLTRMFWHRWQYAPMNLPEAHIRALSPVTGALQLIRAETLTAVGLYDEHFKMGFEDMDYCFRVFMQNGECVYNPDVRAFHGESMFRGRRSDKLDRWHKESLMYLMWKYREQSFAGLVPTW